MEEITRSWAPVAAIGAVLFALIAVVAARNSRARRIYLARLEQAERAAEGKGVDAASKAAPTPRPHPQNSARETDADRRDAHLYVWE